MPLRGPINRSTIVERRGVAKIPRSHQTHKRSKQRLAQRQQLIKEPTLDLMSRRAFLRGPTDPPDQRLDLLTNLGNLPFQRNRLIDIALFRVLCHHVQASLPGKIVVVQPHLWQTRHFF